MSKESFKRAGVKVMDINILSRMDRAGITFDRLVKQLKEELGAFEVKAFSSNGKVVYSKKLIAWPIRQKARMDAHDLRGDYPAQQIDHTINGNVNFISQFTPELLEKLIAKADKVGDAIIKRHLKSK